MSTTNNHSNSPPYSPPLDTGLDFIHINEHFLIVNKPHGLLSVPGKGEDKMDCLSHRVQQRFPLANIVHRLDMETSGIFIMALHRRAQSSLGKLFEQRAIKKEYIAVVAGLLSDTQGTIDLPMRGDWENRPRQMIDPNQGKSALTHFEVIQTNSETGISRILLRPHTGRSHQLRLHMQAIGHPILGDRLYAPESTINAADRLLLHASKIHFCYPDNNTEYRIECPPTF